MEEPSTKFFADYEDTSDENIQQVANFLNKKPMRQGSNQRIEDEEEGQ